MFGTNQRIEQPMLFDAPPSATSVEATADVPTAVAARKLARTSHPETSLMTAKEFVASGKQQQGTIAALRLVQSNPGKTAAELDRIDGTKCRRIGKRLGDLRNDGFVRYGEKRVCTVGGKRCVTWFAIEVDAMNETMPDAETCPKTPHDSNGELIRPGRYGQPKPGGAFAFVVDVFEDIENDCLVYQTKGSKDACTLVSDSDPDQWAKTVRIGDTDE
jgi:hypothetical protein